MSETTVYTFRIASGEEIIGQVLNPSSLDSGTLLVEYPMIVDWNELPGDIPGSTRRIYNFFPVMITVSESNTIGFIIRNLVTAPIQASTDFASAYRQYVEKKLTGLEQSARLRNYFEDYQHQRQSKGRNTGQSLAGGR